MTTELRTLDRADVDPFWGPLDKGKNGHARKLTKSNRPRVVAILPRGETIRNFVYTGAWTKSPGRRRSPCSPLCPALIFRIYCATAITTSTHPRE